MNDKTQKIIDCYFDKLTDYINKLPLPDEARNYLWMDSFCQFYDKPVQSECGKNTYGIQTNWQLQRFIEQFKIRLNDLRIKAIEIYTDKLNRIEPSEAVANIDKHLYKLRQKELIEEIGGDNMSDWENWSVKYLSYQLDHQQKRPSIKPPKQQKRTTYQWQGNADKELPELYSLMINKHKLIASDTTLEQFTAIFTGQPIKNIRPIKWNVSKTLNAYFIEQLINKNKLSKAINIDIWVISKYCFSNGANFSQSIDNYKNSKTGKPSNYNLIDDLLNAL
jgi:hypothetical protein